MRAQSLAFHQQASGRPLVQDRCRILPRLVATLRSVALHLRLSSPIQVSRARWRLITRVAHCPQVPALLQVCPRPLRSPLPADRLLVAGLARHHLPPSLAELLLRLHTALRLLKQAVTERRLLQLAANTAHLLLAVNSVVLHKERLVANTELLRAANTELPRAVWSHKVNTAAWALPWVDRWAAARWAPT